MYKKLIVIFSIYFYCTILLAQNAWIRKNDILGGARSFGVTFVINQKGYLALGIDTLPRNELWEYDPIQDTWTQKANFLGDFRLGATAFSIGNQGYICSGGEINSGSPINDFWQFNLDSNNWYPKAIFASLARVGAVSFSINGYGYITCGIDRNDLLRYDPIADQWMKMTSMPIGPRSFAVGFEMNGRGYIGLGEDEEPFLPTYFYTDFWEYDPSQDSWLQKRDFPASQRTIGLGFSIGQRGYIGSGLSPFRELINDFWSFNPDSNQWQRAENFWNIGRQGAGAFSINGKGYIFTGGGIIDSVSQESGGLTDVWEYNPLIDSLINFQNEIVGVTFTVYPNPNNGYFNLLTENNYSLLRIYNQGGIVIYTKNLNKKENCKINISAQPDGLYYVELKINNSNFIKKMLIQH